MGGGLYTLQHLLVSILESGNGIRLRLQAGTRGSLRRRSLGAVLRWRAALPRRAYSNRDN